MKIKLPSVGVVLAASDLTACAKKYILLALGGVCLWLMGCGITSVYPFYTEKDLIFDPALVGHWEKVNDDKDPDPIEFKKSGDKEYRLWLKEGETKEGHVLHLEKYAVHLFKLRTQLFLDLLPVERHEDSIPVHHLMKADQITPTLKMATLSDNWLSELLKKTPGALAHQLIPDPNDPNKSELVLTAPTRELQRFLLKQLKNNAAFEPTQEWKRR